VGHVAHLVNNMMTGVSEGFKRKLGSTALVIVPQVRGQT
jgi:ribosomal protein L6P/L9E